jgi:hypothetical protein
MDIRACLTLVFVTVMFMPGCGDAPPGQDPVLPPTPPGECARDTVNGSFKLDVVPGYGSFHGSYHDVAYPRTLVEHLRQGECAFYAPEPSFCDPPCEGSTCAVGGVCWPWPRGVDVGRVTVTGTSPTIELDPYAPGAYATFENLPDPYQPGDTLTLRATGGEQAAGFELSALGVPALTLPQDTFTAIEGQDLVITWDTADSPPGTQVVVHMDSDHHGIEAYVECRSSDTGSVTVGAAVLDRLIEAGETGIGTYIENAWMHRVNDAVKATEDGCVVFGSISHLPIAVETVRTQ